MQKNCTQSIPNFGTSPEQKTTRLYVMRFLLHFISNLAYSWWLTQTSTRWKLQHTYQCRKCVDRWYEILCHGHQIWQDVVQMMTWYVLHVVWDHQHSDALDVTSCYWLHNTSNTVTYKIIQYYTVHISLQRVHLYCWYQKICTSGFSSLF